MFTSISLMILMKCMINFWWLMTNVRTKLSYSQQSRENIEIRRGSSNWWLLQILQCPQKKFAALHIMDIGNTGNMLWIFVTILPQDNELTYDEPKTAIHKGAVLNGDYRFGCTQWMLMKPSCSLTVCTQQCNATRNMLLMYVESSFSALTLSVGSFDP